MSIDLIEEFRGIASLHPDFPERADVDQTHPLANGFPFLLRRSVAVGPFPFSHVHLPRPGFDVLIVHGSKLDGMVMRTRDHSHGN